MYSAHFFSNQKQLNPICYGLLGLVTFMGGHKVSGLNLRALNCCLTLKLCVCFQKHKLTSHEKENWSKSQKSSEILRFKMFYGFEISPQLDSR